MPVYVAYALVVIIWSTTPLAIQWSNDSVSFVTAVVMRMTLAAALALVAVLLLRRRLFTDANAWKAYLAASFGIFPNMLVVYWSAQFIPSGLIAVIFALSPFVTGGLSWLILKENPFSRRRILALVVALAGLCVIFWDQIQIDERSVFGIGGILLSCGLFSLSSVSLKRLQCSTGPLEQTAGALLFALPGLLLCWWLVEGTLPLPQTLSPKSLTGLLYLAVLGSLAGFTLFYFVLQRMTPSAVSLITLMTPVLALMIGSLVADEHLSPSLLIGAGMVLLALLAYLDLGVEAALRQRLVKRKKATQTEVEVNGA
ncbi:DMT family transporter [Marinimicrobium agarilyticum]|uniref:DMT family transporter n=1 Tax=Marinimicrobium agarilyticum TaxID=306546 RepID=UPI00041DE6FF|nr:DMT family transporter [Marinimicrobium agarilyticum]